MLKLKKILSVVSAFAIALTTFAGMTVAKAADEATIYTVLEKKDFSDSSDYDGYTQYVLTIKAKNLNNLKAFTTSGVGANKKYTGAGATMIEAHFGFDATKVGMCDINPLVEGGSVTKNVENGDFLWTCTDIAQYITTTSIDIAEIHFVSIADEEWSPATEDYTANPISFTGNAKIEYSIYDNQKATAQDFQSGVYSVGTSTLVAENGAYGAAPAPTPSYPSDETYVTEELTVADVTNPYVRISLGEKTKDYYLPAGVKGDFKVYGLLKYTADGENIKHGDVFKLELRSKTTADGVSVKALADHTVNAAD